MKVLVNRSWSYVSCRLTIFSIVYNWSARTEERILAFLYRYLRVKLPKFKRFTLTPNRDTLYTLHPEKLRKLIRLCEIICKFPDMFDRIFKCFLSVPLVRLDTILRLDKEWGCP
jgi:hypothetical protein